MDEASLRSQIAQNIRIYRAMFNITQEQLANMCNTTQQYINQIENEKVTISVYTLLKIAESLEIEANDLIYAPTLNKSLR